MLIEHQSGNWLENGRPTKPYTHLEGVVERSWRSALLPM